MALKILLNHLGIQCFMVLLGWLCWQLVKGSWAGLGFAGGCFAVTSAWVWGVSAKLATAFCGGRLRPVSAELGVAELVGVYVARPALRSAGLVFGSWQLVHCQHLSSEFV